MNIIRLVALALTTFAIPLIDADLTEAAEIRSHSKSWNEASIRRASAPV